MGQGIDTGRGADTRRHGNGQFRIDNGHIGKEKIMRDDVLAAFQREYGNIGHFRTCAGSGRDHNFR